MAECPGTPEAEMIGETEEPDDGWSGQETPAVAQIVGRDLQKSELRYDWKTGEGYIALSQGIPPGFADIAKPLTESVSRQLRTGNDASRPPDRPPLLPLTRILAAKPGMELA